MFKGRFDFVAARRHQQQHTTLANLKFPNKLVYSVKERANATRDAYGGAKI